jgi:hypothetical protein
MSARPPEPAWTASQLERKARAETGECVVAHLPSKTQAFDIALIEWAKANRRFVRIDRKSKWGNHEYKMVDGYTRDECVDFYKQETLAKRRRHLIEEAKSLRGKVLGCWCYPERCHGDVLAEIANTQSFVYEAAQHPERRESDAL